MSYLNAFRIKHGVQHILASWNVVNSLPNLNCEQLKLAFETYIQVSIDEAIVNTMRSFTCGAVALDTKETNGKHKFLSLAVGMEVQRKVS